MWTAILLYDDWEYETFHCENKSWADYYVRRRYEKWRRITIKAFYATKANEIDCDKIIRKFQEEENEYFKKQKEKEEIAKYKELKKKYW